MADFADTELHLPVLDSGAEPVHPASLQARAAAPAPIKFPVHNALEQRQEAIRRQREEAALRHAQATRLAMEQACADAHRAGRAIGRNDAQLSTWTWGACTGGLLVAALFLHFWG